MGFKPGRYVLTNKVRGLKVEVPDKFGILSYFWFTHDGRAVVLYHFSKTGVLNTTTLEEISQGDEPRFKVWEAMTRCLYTHL